MKYLFNLFLFISQMVIAQNAVAELKFEEAETAFNNGNYELTIQKVDEFETTLGGMTDKSLYLRVISQKKLFNPANFYTDENQFTLYNSLLKNANKYIEATQNKGLDDKFKEIYAISEKLKNLNLPKDKTSYQKEKQLIVKEKQDRQDLCTKVFDDLTVDNLPFDITLDEFLAQYPNILSNKKYKLTKGIKFELYQPKDSYITYSTNGKFDFFGINTLFAKIETNDISILVKNNKIIGYQKQIYWYAGKDLKLPELENEYNKLYSKNSPLYNCAEPHYSDENLPEGLRQVFYWKFNNKTALINKSYSKQGKFYFYSVIYRVTKSDEVIEGF